MKWVSGRPIVTLLLLGATLVASKISEYRRSDTLAAPLESIDRQVAGWTAARNEQLETEVLQVLDATSYLARSYEKDQRTLDLFIAYYAQQRAGESMHSPKNCLPGSGWEIWRHGSATVRFEGSPVKINKYSIQNGNRRMLMFYWYQSKGRVLASEYFGKILLVRDALWEGTTAGSIVRITVADEPRTEQDGLTFATRIVAEVRRCLGG